MKRSEAREEIAKILRSTVGGDAAKYLAENILHRLEQIKVAKPPGYVRNFESGEVIRGIKFDGWEQESNSDNGGGNMTTKETIEHLKKTLKEDPSYRYTWQANIAMAFKDECSREMLSFPQLHDIANRAASNFLDILCLETESIINPDNGEEE